MALTILTAAPTTEPPSPGVVAAGKIDQCWLGGGPRNVCEIEVSGAAMDVQPYRWSENLGKWIPSIAGSATLNTGPRELRIEDGILSAYRCLVRTGGAGTGTYYPADVDGR